MLVDKPSRVKSATTFRNVQASDRPVTGAIHGPVMNSIVPRGTSGAPPTLTTFRLPSAPVVFQLPTSLEFFCSQGAQLDIPLVASAQPNMSTYLLKHAIARHDKHRPSKAQTNEGSALLQLRLLDQRKSQMNSPDARLGKFFCAPPSYT